MTDNRQYSKGFPFVSVLTICFVVLKLCGVIRWTWWWVLSPMWISFALLLLLAIVLALIDTGD